MFWPKKIFSVFKLNKSAETLLSNAPPVHSVYWGPATFCKLSYIPITHTQYELSANWEDDHRMIATLGQEIIQKICAGHMVLLKEKLKNQSSADEKAHGFQFIEDDAAIPIDGFRCELLSTDAERFSPKLCDYEYLLFSKNITPTSVRQALEFEKSNLYDMRLFITPAPYALEMILCKKTVDIVKIQEVIQAICDKNNFSLYIEKD